jgi:phosphoribosyl 1,2-cyclic phosphodiesterase
MNFTLWGVRGSIPCPGPTTVRYGGNTLCLEVRYGPSNRLIIIDAGSGIRPLGTLFFLLSSFLPARLRSMVLSPLKRILLIRSSAARCSTDIFL